MISRYGRLPLRSMYYDAYYRNKSFKHISSRPEYINYAGIAGIWDLNSTTQFKKSEPQNAISIINRSMAYSSSDISDVTSINVTIPSGVLSNDLILIIVGSNSTTAGYFNDYVPTGFTYMASNGYGDQGRSGIFYKVAGGSESGTTINCAIDQPGDMWASCLIIRNVDISNPHIGTSANAFYTGYPQIYLTGRYVPSNTLQIVALTWRTASFGKFPIIKDYGQYDTYDFYGAANPSTQTSSNVSGVIATRYFSEKGPATTLLMNLESPTFAYDGNELSIFIRGLAV